MFKSIGQFFSNLFKGPEVKAFEAWCVTVFDAEKSQILNQLKNFAIAEVTALLTNLAISGSAKKAIAMTNVGEAAKTAGIAASAADISLAIEMALAGIRNVTPTPNANAGITVNGQPAPVNNQENVNG